MLKKSRKSKPRWMKDVGEIALLGGGCLAVGAGLIGLLLLFPYLFWLLWQGVAVAAFHAPSLTFWQAWGLWILLSLVFGGFRVNTTSSK